MNTQRNTQLFQGFRSPHYTMVPDELFDDLLSTLSGSELKVLLYIIRRTFGFKQDSDTISLSQMLNGITKRNGSVLDRGTGLSKPTLLQALRSLQDRNIIFAERQESEARGHEPTLYRLNVQAGTLGKENYPPLVKKVDQGVGKELSPRARSNKLTTQDTESQETVRQETALHNSNIRMVQKGDGEGGSGREESADDSQREASSPTSVGDILAGSTPKRRARSRPEAETEEWQVIQEYVTDLARLLGDGAPLKSSTTRAYNLFKRSGLSLGDFIGKMLVARSYTQESSAGITKTHTDSRGLTRKAKMAYFFAVLEEKLGFTPPKEPSALPTKKPAAKKPKPANGASSHPRRPRDSEGPYSHLIEH